MRTGQLRSSLTDLLRRASPAIDTVSMYCFAFKRRSRRTASRVRTWRSADAALFEIVWQMNNNEFASVWDAINDTPEEAKNMKLRSGLMMALKTPLARLDLSRLQGAK